MSNLQLWPPSSLVCLKQTCSSCEASVLVGSRIKKKKKKRSRKAILDVLAKILAKSGKRAKKRQGGEGEEERKCCLLPFSSPVIIVKVLSARMLKLRSKRVRGVFRYFKTAPFAVNAITLLASQYPWSRRQGIFRNNARCKMLFS